MFLPWCSTESLSGGRRCEPHYTFVVAKMYVLHWGLGQYLLGCVAPLKYFSWRCEGVLDGVQKSNGQGVFFLIVTIGPVGPVGWFGLVQVA